MFFLSLWTKRSRYHFPTQLRVYQNFNNRVKKANKCLRVLNRHFSFHPTFSIFSRGWRFQGESLALPVRCWENKVSLLRAAANLFLPFLEESVGQKSVPGSQCFSQLSTLKNDKILYLAPTRVHLSKKIL